MALTCPHCGAPAAAEDLFCASCGKAVASGSSGPRLVEGKDLASTDAGMAVQSDELRRKAGSASKTLIVVGVLQLVLGGLAAAGGFLLDNSKKPIGIGTRAYDLRLVGIGACILGLLFVALGFWAKRSPLAASITGLVLCLTLWGADIAVDPAMVLNGILIKVIVVLALVRAIRAGLQHRRLRLRTADGGA